MSQFPDASDIRPGVHLLLALPVAPSTAVGVQTTVVDEVRSQAEAGEAEAQYRLGAMYDTGFGVARDDAEAMRWYRRAAELGHAGARNFVGTLYRLGRGVARDYAAARRADAFRLVPDR